MRIPPWALILALLALPLAAGGQSSPSPAQPSTLDKVKALKLPHIAGAVPAYYSSGFEARALKYQKALIASQQWYDQQVGKHVEFALAVLNKPDWEKTLIADYVYPLPYSLSLGDPIVVLPGRFEDYPNSTDFTDDVELLVENIAYHELGHIYAHYINMETDDNLLAELYANLFMVSFVRAHRPDMLVYLHGPSAKLPPQRYTSLEDLQYIASDVGMTNYGWFQFQLYRLSDLLLQNKPLPKLLAEMKIAFPDPTLRPFSSVAPKLEAIHPGLREEMGPLWKPTTLPETQTKACGEAPGTGKDSALVVQNMSAKPVTLTIAKQPAVTVPPNSWTTFEGHAGESVHVDASSCFVIGDEPAIARIQSK